MWPGKKSEKDKGSRATALFEDLDEYVEKKSGGRLMFCCLGVWDAP